MNIEDPSINYKDLGIAEFKKQNYHSAIRFFTEAISHQNDPTFYSNRAACYHMLKDYSQSIKDTEQILEFAPTFHKAYTRMGQAQLCTGQIDMAIISFRLGLNTESGASDPQLKKNLDKANLLSTYYDDLQINFGEGNFVDGIRKADMILEDCPDFNEVKVKRIEMLNKGGDLEAARKSIEAVCGGGGGYCEELRMRPEFGFLKGQAVLYGGEVGDAVEIWKRVLVANPEYGRIAEAIRAVRNSQKLKEEGTTLFKAGSVREALEKWEAAVAIDPYHKRFNSLVFGNIMTCWNKLNDTVKSLKAINDAIRCDPNYAKAYFKRAEIYVKIEDFPGAIRDFQTAQNLDPGLNLQSKIQEMSKKASQAKNINYYDILGLSKSATDDEIKKSYRKMCLKFHPDRQDSEEARELANKKILDINEAYDV
jgi:tetratricopeptide (TPR) repeat protein